MHLLDDQATSVADGRMLVLLRIALERTEAAWRRSIGHQRNARFVALADCVRQTLRDRHVRTVAGQARPSLGAFAAVALPRVAIAAISERATDYVRKERWMTTHARGCEQS